MAGGRFPGGRRFAFSIIDDTDVSTVDNVQPIYRLLEHLGMRTTKTVWPLPCPEGSRNYDSSQTLADREYLEFVLDLQRRGFEITWHGATMESSTRERTLAGLARFQEVFGHAPRVHANHGANRENLYWGAGRVDAPVLKRLLTLVGGDGGHYLGHVEGSAYWWGDLAGRHIEYARNLTYDELNLARINPTMPYHDPARPLVPMWFSASDGEARTDFDRLLHPRRQDRLEREGGVCIIATHFGKDFVQGGEVHPRTRERLEMLANRDGWFPTVGELLDWLRDQRTSHVIPRREWAGMQWRWAWGQLRRHAAVALRRSGAPTGVSAINRNVYGSES